MRVSVYKHVFASFLIFTMLTVAIFGVHVGRMAQEMTGCPFMPGSSLCPMGLIDHLDYWQHLLAAVLPFVALLLLLLIAMAYMSRVFMGKWSRHRFRGEARLSRQYCHEHAPPLLNYFVCLFSDGILALRIYA